MITVTYKGGESRVIHPTPSFYAPDKEFTVEDKALKLVKCLGKDFYKFTLYSLEGDVILERTEPRNEPLPKLKGKVSPKIKRQRYEERHALRNEFKNVPFLYSSKSLAETK